MGNLEEGPTLEALAGQVDEVLRRVIVRVLLHGSDVRPLELSEEDVEAMLTPFAQELKHYGDILRESQKLAMTCGKEEYIQKFEDHTIERTEFAERFTRGK